MTDIEIVNGMKKGDRIAVNKQILKIEKIEEFSDDLGDEWKLFYLEEGYKLKVNKDKINFFHVAEMNHGDEFLENIEIEKIEKAIVEK